MRYTQPLWQDALPARPPAGEYRAFRLLGDPTEDEPYRLVRMADGKFPLNINLGFCRLATEAKIICRWLVEHDDAVCAAYSAADLGGLSALLLAARRSFSEEVC